MLQITTYANYLSKEREYTKIFTRPVVLNKLFTNILHHAIITLYLLNSFMHYMIGFAYSQPLFIPPNYSQQILYSQVVLLQAGFIYPAVRLNSFIDIHFFVNPLLFSTNHNNYP